MSEGTVSAVANVEAIDALYQNWRRDPASVDPSWRTYFEGFELGLSMSASPVAGGSDNQLGLFRLIYAYRDIGHYCAHLDPLSESAPDHAALALTEFGFSDADLGRVVDTQPFLGLGKAKLGALIDALQETYCGHIGAEYMYIQDRRIRQWIQERMEPRRNRPEFDRERKRRILHSLFYAEKFEKFIHTRFSGQKRFSLEGAETLIPVLEALVDHAPNRGIHEIVLGMAHRGRLNVLATTMRKPYEDIFAQFEGDYLPDSADGDGDVKYHLGASADRVTVHGKRVHVSLSPNPSHLEAVDPVVEGRTRAKQTRFGDLDRQRGMPVLIHGDASVAGQGLVCETLNLSQLAGYKTGGTVHIVINNQIGFTTGPEDARSTRYCTDVAKMIQAPVFHVNAEDPEAACFLTELAIDFRNEFKCDVFIDLVCYRRYGHNEADEPAFTQPVMYAKIRNRPTMTTVYQKTLIDAGDLTAAEAGEITAKFEEKLEHSLDQVKHGPHEYPTMRGFEGDWKGFTPHYSHAPVETGVGESTLREIADRLCVLPEGFEANSKVTALMNSWRHDLAERRPLPWAFAEALAFGSLLLEGTPVRLSGQDSRRGTFGQRHSSIYDTRDGTRYTPLANLRPGQAIFEAYDSFLSEAAVLGFEFGYSLDAPKTLVLWEAQFGDFANGAQVIIDQFIASSESKWQRDSGLVLLLPHGYEGQGPEHSSARLERFLQLCADDNIQVVNATTPAQYFHVLRRQMRRDFRKPLVIMTPKSLLRATTCVSPVQEFVTGTFSEVIDDPTIDDPSQVRRVVLCSGKLYYDLAKERAALEDGGVALVRVEQFYPFPDEQLAQLQARYRDAGEWVWAQEESQNNGAWSYMALQLRSLGIEPVYVGRDPSASPATGSIKVHQREQAEVVSSALRGSGEHLVRATSSAESNGQPA
jgi:2-oxoglutarate dehydrogenase E1 component